MLFECFQVNAALLIKKVITTLKSANINEAKRTKMKYSLDKANF